MASLEQSIKDLTVRVEKLEACVSKHLNNHLIQQIKEDRRLTCPTTKQQPCWRSLRQLFFSRFSRS